MPVVKLPSGEYRVHPPEVYRGHPGCGVCIGHLGSFLYCGTHGLCGACHAATGDAPSAEDLSSRRAELDRFMRERCLRLGVSEADVLAATNASFFRFHSWLLGGQRTPMPTLEMPGART